MSIQVILSSDDRRIQLTHESALIYDHGALISRDLFTLVNHVTCKSSCFFNVQEATEHFHAAELELAINGG